MRTIARPATAGRSSSTARSNGSEDAHPGPGQTRRHRGSLRFLSISQPNLRIHRRQGEFTVPLFAEYLASSVLNRGAIAEPTVPLAPGCRHGVCARLPRAPGRSRCCGAPPARWRSDEARSAWRESPLSQGSSGSPTTRPSRRGCSGAAAPPAARRSSRDAWSAPSACTRGPRTSSCRPGAPSTPGPTATSRCSARRTPTSPATAWPRSTCPRGRGCSRSSRAGATTSPLGWRSRSTSRRCARTRTATTW